MVLRYGSVCSGIEAVSVAWQGMGFSGMVFGNRTFPVRRLGAPLPKHP